MVRGVVAAEALPGASGTLQSLQISCSEGCGGKGYCGCRGSSAWRFWYVPKRVNIVFLGLQRY